LAKGSSCQLKTWYTKVGERTKKLLPRYVGPFEITDRIGLVAYKLKLPSTVKIHPVFHVSLLKPYKQGISPNEPLPELDLIGGEEHYELGSIVADRMAGEKQKYRQYLVRWKGYDPSHDDWLYEDDLIEDAPQAAPLLIKAYWKVKKNRNPTGKQPESRKQAKKRKTKS
jgi:hypothetical protein